ncbi:MAG: hypothetical protein ACRD4B_03800, partial [Acidobacteriota bacterium]
DMDWRSISMTEPLTLATPYGNIDINYPIGLLQANPLSYLIQQADRLVHTEQDLRKSVGRKWYQKL